ncbi:MAG: sigma-70 family RNA polymerase sigma factor [Planctomycetaceae bacterium]|nr:sigma-70 family RNA polymerase sigma factor [Planctomycetaceae bacterium]
MSDVTNILGQIEDGDPSAAEKLLPLVYEELRKLASAKMSQESPDHTLQPTGLVHEAYLRLVDVDKAQKWNSRGHFFGAAAEAMRRILIDNARRKKNEKHGGNHQRVPLHKETIISENHQFDLLEIDEAISELEKHDPQSAELIKLRFFAGIDHQDAAQVMGISRRQADRLWTLSRAWLMKSLQESSRESFS